MKGRIANAIALLCRKDRIQEAEMVVTYCDSDSVTGGHLMPKVTRARYLPQKVHPLMSSNTLVICVLESVKVSGSCL